LTRVLDPKFPDGSRAEPSGRGFFNGVHNGIDVTVKDSKRFAKTSGWGFFTFGHHPLPYAETAAEAPASECASCHETFVAKSDMTWIQFYPLLRDKESGLRIVIQHGGHLYMQTNENRNAVVHYQCARTGNSLRWIVTPPAARAPELSSQLADRKARRIRLRAQPV